MLSLYRHRNNLNKEQWRLEVIIRYGKPSGPLLALKQKFIDDNELLLEREREVNRVYAQQPARTCCKNCDHPLEEQVFVKQCVAYTICVRCGHLNGLHQDTEAFCASVYTDDSGKNYAKNYGAENKFAYLKRVDDIYVPKAEFLLSSLGQLKEEVATLRYADFGAGSGYFVCALVKQGIANVLGFEVSKTQVELGNAMLEEKLLKTHSLDKAVDLAESVDADVVSMIGVLEHLQQPRKFLEALRDNPNVRFLYLSVPTFSLTVYFEMVFPKVMQRQLTQGHTHLYTSQSLDWLANEFNMQQIAAWWFGTDMVDLFRNVAVKLGNKAETINMVEPWAKVFTPLIDDLQLEIDKKHLASEVHMLFQFKN
jgi:hypothetical protein